MTTPDPLHLPATIPGLLRRGSPVVSLVDLDACDGDGYEIPAGAPGNVCHADGIGPVLVAFVAMPNDPGPDLRWRWCDVADLALDLHDATARHHALLWLAGREGLYVADGVQWFSGTTERVWTILTSARPFAPIRAYCGWRDDDMALHVPTLADLDPTSDERLADGSRRVDALALARVVAHVAGVGRG